MDIIKLISGPTEYSRGQKLFDNSSSTWKVKIIPDHPSDYFATLKPKGRLKSHHINIFGTAHRLNCTTLTCNGYIHESLEDQGVLNLSVWSLEPRSLIEQRWQNICKKNAYIDDS
jgi:hypothetical protein